MSSRMDEAAALVDGLLLENDVAGHLSFGIDIIQALLDAKVVAFVEPCPTAKSQPEFHDRLMPDACHRCNGTGLVVNEGEGE